MTRFPCGFDRIATLVCIQKTQYCSLTLVSHQNRLNQLWNKDWSNYRNTNTAILIIDCPKQKYSICWSVRWRSRAFCEAQGRILQVTLWCWWCVFQQVIVFFDPIRSLLCTHLSVMPFPERKFQLLTFFWSPFQPQSSLLNVGIAWITLYCCCCCYSCKNLKYIVLVNSEVWLHCMLNW